MLTLTFQTIINCILVAFVMNIAARLHQIFLPRSYSSILDFRYSGDAAKTIRSSSIRLIYVALISIGFYMLGIPSEEIYFGVFVSAFLNVWLAVVQYKLITFTASADKLKLLLGYGAFVIFSVLFSYISIITYTDHLTEKWYLVYWKARERIYCFLFLRQQGYAALKRL